MAHPIVYGQAGSTYVWSARLALAEKGVTHELVEVRFGGHREEPHLSRHPFAKVPAFTIGHLKAEHRMDRNYLKGRDGDRINAVLAAAGYNSASSCAGWRDFWVL
jgi:glutathione S-transferase